MDLQLNESYVKHVKYNPFKKTRTDYVEGNNNHAIGSVVGNLFKGTFINSQGCDSRVEGTVLRIGRVWLLSGTAYGYTDFPEGRKMVAIMWRGKTYLHCRVPAAHNEYLAIRMKYNLKKEAK